MSEILDQSADALLLQSLSENDSGKKVYIQSEDPLGLYNHVIKQFNAACNRTTDHTYESLPTNCFYGVWMLRWWTLLRCDTYIFMLIISFIVNFAIGLIPIVNLVSLMIWLICYLVYERCQRAHWRTNRKIASDPFKYMIYNNGLVRQANMLNLYYDLPVSGLSSFGIKESQIEILKSKRNGGMVTVMVYGDRFRNAWTRFGFLRIVHILHILICTLSLIIANVLIYPKTHIGEFFQST
jgi:hypothetical protein